MSLSLVDVSVDESDSKPPMKGDKGGAPAGNGNAVRHGLTAGQLPKGAAYIARSTSQFRTALEGAIVEMKGEISLHDAAVIQTAIRWERHALLVQRWLRKELTELTPDQRLSFSRDVARASAERDKCLRVLGLDRDRTRDLFDGLYDDPLHSSPQMPATASSDQTTPGTPSERIAQQTTDTETDDPIGDIFRENHL